MHRLVLVAVAWHVDEAGEPTLGGDDLVALIGHESAGFVHEVVGYYAAHGILERREDGRVVMVDGGGA